jgi:hypothetical protein
MIEVLNNLFGQSFYNNYGDVIYVYGFNNSSNILYIKSSLLAKNGIYSSPRDTTITLKELLQDLKSGKLVPFLSNKETHKETNKAPHVFVSEGI